MTTQVILGARLDDESRHDIAAMIADSHGVETFLVPRVGEKNPAKLVTTVNENAIEWKFRQVLGPGDPGVQVDARWEPVDFLARPAHRGRLSIRLVEPPMSIWPLAVRLRCKSACATGRTPEENP